MVLLLEDLQWGEDPLLDVVEHALSKGATTVLMPVSCRRGLVDLSDDVATKVQVFFYADAPDALKKALHE
jgi:ATP-dependent Lon protease